MTMVGRVAEDVRGERATSTWTEVDTGFWVGSTDGAYLGSVERLGRTRYLARDEVNRLVGEYVGLDHARDAVVGGTHRE